MDGRRGPNRVIGAMYSLRGMDETSRPENLESKVREDVGKIAKMGFNTLYLFDIYRDPELGATYAPLWYPPEAPEGMEPLPFDQETQDEMEGGYGSALRSALCHDMVVIPSICYNIPAQWLWENGDALKRRPDGSPHHTVYYHECFRSEKVLQYTRGRLEQLLSRYAENPEFQGSLARFEVDGGDAVLGEGGSPLFVIHNDTVDRGFCYCESCRRAWGRDFLPEIYTDVENFNRVHGTDYDSFTGIPLPEGEEDIRLWYEMGVFFTRGLKAWIREIRDTIRDHIPDALISMVLKYPRSLWAMQYPDWPSICELCDIVMMDSYPMEGGGVWNIPGYAFDIETYRSISLQTAKPLIPQFQLSSSYSEISMEPVKIPTKTQILEQFYVGIGRGAKGFISWAFPPAIADETGKMMGEAEIIETAREILEEAKRLFAASEGTTEGYGRIMLPYNYPTAIREEKGLREPYRLFTALSNLGLIANPACMRLFGETGDLDHVYDALIGFRSLRYTNGDAVPHLLKWLEDGGMILCSDDSLLMNEGGERLHMESPSISRIDSEHLPRHGTQEFSDLLYEFAKGLPGPIAVSGEDLGNVVFSYRPGKDKTIVYLVNNNPQVRQIRIRFGYLPADDTGRLTDALTGEEMPWSFSDGTVVAEIGLDPWASRAMVWSGEIRQALDTFVSA